MLYRFIPENDILLKIQAPIIEFTFRMPKDTTLKTLETIQQSTSQDLWKVTMSSSYEGFDMSNLMER